jgi:hypothetical protein
MYVLQYRLLITYHGDEECGGLGGWSQFCLDCESRDEWLRKIDDACSIVADVVGVTKQLAVSNALAATDRRRPSAYKTADIFVPCHRQRLEEVFGHFSPRPFALREHLAAEVARCSEALGVKNKEARRLPASQRFNHVREAFLALKHAEHVERTAGFGDDE